MTAEIVAQLRGIAAEREAAYTRLLQLEAGMLTQGEQGDRPR